MDILLTGATSGIGQAIATGLAQDGHRLILHGRDAVRLARLQKRLQKPARHSVVVGDFSDPRQFQALSKTLKANTRHLDAVINNAFGKLEKKLSECTPTELADFFQVSVAGTASLIRVALPLLKKSDSPRLVNVVADWGFPMHNIMTGPAPYIAAKYAVHGLGAALQTELGPAGIRTTSLCPGVVAADARYDMGSLAFTRKYGKSAIHPRVLVDAIRFVLTAESAHIRSLVLSPTNPRYNGL